MGLVATDPKQTTFQRQRELSRPASPVHSSGVDFYIVSVGFVLKTNQLLGSLYGASAVPTLDQNEIFARWLQKKTVIVDTAGNQYSPQGSYGPDRQWFQLRASACSGRKGLPSGSGRRVSARCHSNELLDAPNQIIRNHRLLESSLASKLRIQSSGGPP
jgi:hypothetical protein